MKQGSARMEVISISSHFFFFFLGAVVTPDHPLDSSLVLSIRIRCM
jgi:hypothetical protein